MLTRLILARSSSMALRQQPRLAFSRAAFQATWFSTEAESKPAENKDVAAAAAAGKAEESMGVPKHMVRLLIGSRGKTLASLSERSGAKITFTKTDNAQGEEIAKIAGDASQIAQAKDLIKQELERFKAESEAKAKAGEGGDASTSAHKSKEYMEEVIVDAQYVGVLIGKQGVVLKDMEASSGARIFFNDRDDRAKERTARIRGSPEQVQAAKKLISEKIHNAADEIRSGQRFGGERNRAAPRARRPTSTDIKQVVEVPTEIIGSLIGKAGKSLFRMQDETGAKFDFAQQDHREGAREVTIYGSEEQIRSACNVLQKRVRELLELNQSRNQ